jgi:tRNA modification GTPase
MSMPTATGGDTIVAQATPPGRGGIAVIRISGPDVRRIAGNLIGHLPEPRYASLTNFNDSAGEPVDSGIALFFPAPNSFTGEDVLELQGHGGVMICDLLIERVLELGARLAEPGEFSRRAFLNDKLDLSQAEAIADLIDSGSRMAARAAGRSLRGEFAAAVMALNQKVTDLRMHVEAAIDFPDEDIDFLADTALVARLADVDAEFTRLREKARQGRLLRDGIHVVLAGRPNAGKSSLLNTLVGYDAAIVTDVPGTTRDLVREYIDLDGLPLHIVDTAGLHDGSEQIEIEGIRRTRRQLAEADHALVIVDASAEPLNDKRGNDNPGGDTAALLEQLPGDLSHTIVRNKIDLTGEPPGPSASHENIINVSALTGAGIDSLRQAIRSSVGFEAEAGGTMTARQRHLDRLREARHYFEAGCEQLRENQAGELMAEELLQAQNSLAEITGEFTSDDLLGKIFGKFCIGK